MMTTDFAMPPIASRAEWLTARKALLAKEKEATRRYDALGAERRRLPMVRVEKSYVFEGPEGRVAFPEIFSGRRQLYVHHFMWNEEREEHCPGCTAAADLVFNNPHFLARLHSRDLTFVAISRAPLTKIVSYQKQKGWIFPWYSSFGSDFNYDFHITLDEERAPIEYNYRNKAELLQAGHKAEGLKGDWTGASVFLRDGDKVFHTYSAYARGLDQLVPPNLYHDLTPYGRQEDWEDSPAGWPQQPTHG